MNRIRWSWALAVFTCGLALTATGVWALSIELATRSEITSMWHQAQQQREEQP
ncbi:MULTISPECIES: hypothetical protein [Xanthomonas]|uniref:hypothetical protein n=1 Tax=Xanthomonas TaxID=338 RepID=UPI00031E10E0|nr:MULTISPECIES: hypothetical protein [Xanthomonas]QTK37145.1 hypothetical protein XcgCFBP2526_22775 [Xanthomonas citri pv. glycines CFBP 2526]QTK41703.1 hypothetical protein XcgCFBP7119R_24180 [Xanthomonas citri pv. glycines]UIX78406.1 hypothetical protein LMJ37_23430 [Xanthomonas citri pv. glycines]UIX78418.1 hypothetical protein LMJ37_23265 [Xanthomonas citri pv. glycines]WLA22403.1 hypothetical protein NDK37_23255 [Xanthomonas citri pv. glycines]